MFGNTAEFGVLLHSCGTQPRDYYHTVHTNKGYMLHLTQINLVFNLSEHFFLKLKVKGRAMHWAKGFTDLGDLPMI